MTFKELLTEFFAPYGSLSPAQQGLLEEHYQLLNRWNQKLNLTRINSLEDSVSLHYAESLLLGRSLPSGPLRIADVGSGGGFPGIPVAILRPDLRLDLIESHQRKAVFLSEAVRDLPNVRVIPERAETCDRIYDWMISRAVGPTEVLSLGLAPEAALLVGEQSTSGAYSIERIPWGKNRMLAMFHVERSFAT